MQAWGQFVVVPKDLNRSATSIFDCWGKEELGEVVDSMTKAKLAITELITRSKAAVNELTSCIKSAEKELDQRRQKYQQLQKKRRKDKDGPRGRKSGVALHDQGFSSAQQLSVVALAAIPGHHFNARVPFVVSVDQKHAQMRPDSELFKAIDMCVPKFEQSKRERLGNGAKTVGDLRAQRGLASPEVSDTARTLLDSFVGNGKQELLPMDHSDVNFAPAAYGIEKDYSQVTSEKDHLASIRLCYKGRRSVVMTETVALSAV